jgi:tRNA modification GTPase
MAHFDDTIAALSTPPGESGLAVVRASGPGALAVLARVFRARGGNPPPDAWEHRRLYHGRVVDAGGDVVDEVMTAVMRGPESFTGEDVVEVTCHGSMAVVTRLLEALFAAGARPAQAGEFTRRAFLNGKMDLLQAEAVADLIHARSELQRRVAQRQLEGALSRRLGALADETLALLAEIEANIDFVGEDIDTLDAGAAARMLERHRAELADLLESAPLSRPLREGYQVVIAGAVNAGKSTLFNRLVGEDRAIVTEIPGTTRDLLREAVSIDGLPFVLHDTAGLRGGTGDPVERIGIDRAAGAAASADVVLVVIDRAAALDPSVREAAARLDPARAIAVFSKADLPAAAGMSDIDTVCPGLAAVAVSAQSGEGLPALKSALVERVGGEVLVRAARERVVLGARVAALLRRAGEASGTLMGSLERGTSHELLAVEARDLLACYEEVLGRRYADGVLDTIFSRFCIGK